MLLFVGFTCVSGWIGAGVELDVCGFGAVSGGPGAPVGVVACVVSIGDRSIGILPGGWCSPVLSR